LTSTQNNHFRWGSRQGTHKYPARQQDMQGAMALNLELAEMEPETNNN
jgi:hypothetical protein